VQSVQHIQSHTQGWSRMWGLLDFSPDPIQNLKYTAFVDMIIPKKFCDLLFSHNQPLKLAGV